MDDLALRERSADGNDISVFRRHGGAGAECDGIGRIGYGIVAECHRASLACIGTVAVGCGILATGDAIRRIPRQVNPVLIVRRIAGDNRSRRSDTFNRERRAVAIRFNGHITILIDGIFVIGSNLAVNHCVVCILPCRHIGNLTFFQRTADRNRI